MVHASSTVINKTSPKIPCNRGRHLVRIYSCLPRFRFIVNRPWIVPYRTDMNAVTRPSRGLRGHVAFPFLRRLSGVIFFVYGPSPTKPIVNLQYTAAQYQYLLANVGVPG